MQKQLVAIICIIIALFLVPVSLAPVSSQTVHEDPTKAYPSNSASFNSQLSSVVDYMLALLEITSEDIKNNDFAYANDSFAYFNSSCDDYLDFLKRTDLSPSDFQAIASNLNFTRDELSSFIANAALYNLSYENYYDQVSSGNGAGAVKSAAQAGVSYGNITEAYDHFRTNATVIQKLLESNDLDTTSFDNAISNLDVFMGQISSEYNSPDFIDNGTDLRLAVAPNSVPIGGKANLTIAWITTNGTPVTGAEVKIYFNNILTGKITTDIGGRGTMAYTVPVNISSDSVRIHAEASSKGSNTSPVFSNAVMLNVPDMNTTLAIGVDKGNASYGDSLNVTGNLTSVDGIPLPGKPIGIYLNDERLGVVQAGSNGSFLYKVNITPAMPSGNSSLYAKYERKPKGVFLSSSSSSFTLNIDPKSTSLTLDNDSTFYVGDMAHVRGILKTYGDIPVTGADILVYVDGALYGNNTTVSGGRYDVIIRLPDNATAGTHELYAAFKPENRTALTASSTDILRVAFNDKVEQARVEGLPFIVFKDDILYLNGTLVSGSGAGLNDRPLKVNITGITDNNVRTDKNGSFNLSYMILDTMPLGQAQVSIYDGSYGIAPSPALYSGQILVIPFDKFPAIGAPLLLLAAIAAVAFFLLRYRRETQIPRDVIVEPKSPEKAILKPTVPPISAKSSAEAPLPFRTTSVALSPQGPRFEARPAQRADIPIVFSIDGEISSIKAKISEGSLQDALTLVYLASRKLALVNGFDVRDSMTHNEFYTIMTAKDPAISRPLSFIVRTYEMAGFARYSVNNADLNAAITGLKELYVGLNKKGADK